MALLDDPQGDALREWNAERVFWRGCGLLSDEPPRGDNWVFYGISIGDHFRDHAERDLAREYCEAFNATIRSLIAEHGVPPWAPINRRPGRNRALELLREGSPFHEPEVKKLGLLG